MPGLHIAMRKPDTGNYDHWALYLGNGDEGTIFEVTGEHPNFIRNVIQTTQLEKTMHFIREILVGTISDRDVAALVTAMQELPIDNNTVEWNCQDYCIEAIDFLYEEYIIDEDDQAYTKGRKEAVDKYFGAQ